MMRPQLAFMVLVCVLAMPCIVMAGNVAQKDVESLATEVKAEAQEQAEGFAEDEVTDEDEADGDASEDEEEKDEDEGEEEAQTEEEAAEDAAWFEEWTATHDAWDQVDTMGESANPLAKKVETLQAKADQAQKEADSLGNWDYQDDFIFDNAGDLVDEGSEEMEEAEENDDDYDEDQESLLESSAETEQLQATMSAAEQELAKLDDSVFERLADEGKVGSDEWESRMVERLEHADRLLFGASDEPED